MFLDMAADKSESEYARQRLESCLQATWDCLPDKLFTRLHLTIKHRIDTVITIKG
jgi:hypothetical protein